MVDVSFAKQTINSLPSYLLTLRKRCAFTLAEVLITLGIIGVVAALTMPSLIEKHQKSVTINKLKSTYSILNNAIEHAKADYGLDIINMLTFQMIIIEFKYICI